MFFKRLNRKCQLFIILLSVAVITQNAPGAQSPYGGTQWPLPGTIEAENFDTGGEAVAYHDTDQDNMGGQYRPDEGVDIWNTSDIGGGYKISRNPNGEWLEYTVNIDPGTYDINARVATINSFGQQLRVLLDSVELAMLDVPNTGSWETWESVIARNVTVSGGSNSILRLEVVGNGWINLNWIAFSTILAPEPPTGLIATSGISTVILDWADNVEGDLASYNVYRSTTSGSSYTPIATGILASDYSDNSVTNGTTYYYVVTAVDTSGHESANSNEDSAFPPDLTDDDKIDLGDLAKMALAWLETYDINDSRVIADNWLTSFIEPGVPRINHTKFETQDYVITTHNVMDYDAIPDDDLDDTQAFQTAIDTCNENGGGIIFIPAGKYNFDGRLILKSGVYLRGEWQNPETGDPNLIGTLFSITYGENDPNAEPFIALGQSSGLKDLTLWYPNQDFADPIPYAWTIQQISGMSAGLENITIYNAWQGIQTGPMSNQLLTIKNLFMTALHVGFFRDQVYDCEKLQKVYLRPKYWIESGLAGAPETEADIAALKNYLLQESTGAVISHYDWTWLYEWVIEGFHTGIKTQRSLVMTEDRGPNGGFVNLKLIDNYIGMQVGDINRCGWADVDVEISSNVADAIGIKVTEPLKSIGQFLNVTFDGTFKYCVWSQASYGCITMSGCTFKGWANDGYAVYAESGVIELVQNSFEGSENHVYLGNSLDSAALIGNSFSGSPDIVNLAPPAATVVIDHTDQNLKMCDLSTFEYPDAIYKPEKDELFNVQVYGAVGDGVTDDYQAFTDALNAAESNSGGTVYVPVGQYVLSNGIVIPENTELRGVFDNCHHTIDQFPTIGQKGSELFALCGKGDENGTPFIILKTGASLRGVTIHYPEQKWSDYLANNVFTPFPWTIQSQGQNVHVKDVLLANSYKGADFGTYDSTGHNIDYLCGSVLKTGLYVDNCFGQGYVKNVQWNPSFWAWSDYEDHPAGSATWDIYKSAVRQSLTGFVYGYSQHENTLHTFSFSTQTGIEFIKNPQYGGVNGVFVAHGIDWSGISMTFEDVGDNAQFVNFQIVSMAMDDRKRYLDIKENVQGKGEFYNLLGWGHNPCTETGIEMKSGDFYFLLSSFASFALEGGYGIHQTGGTLKSVGMRFGEPINSPIFGGYTSGLYGKFGANISQAELIGTIKKNNISDASSFENYAGSKLDINHSIYHIGW